MLAIPMGSNHLVSAKAVAGLLGVTPRMVYHYVRSGLLHPRYDKALGRRGTMLFDKHEVSAVAEALSRPATFSEIMVRSTQAHVMARSLLKRVEQLEELLGAKFEQPPLDEEAVMSLYLEARDDLESPPAEPERINYWARFFLSASEEFFDVLEAYSCKENSWETFYDLSRAIAEEAPLELQNDGELQAAYKGFAMGRKHLREVLFFYLRARHGTKDAVRMFEADVPAHEKVLRFLSATLDPKGRTSRRLSSRRLPS